MAIVKGEGWPLVYRLGQRGGRSQRVAVRFLHGHGAVRASGLTGVVLLRAVQDSVLPDCHRKRAAENVRRSGGDLSDTSVELSQVIANVSSSS